MRLALVAAAALAAALLLFGPLPDGQAQTTASAPLPAGAAKATFAGGCFWCTEADFDKIDGVLSTTSGYTGGRTTDPTYKRVSREDTGHAEAVEVVFDPAKVTYAQLLERYWRSIDPTVKDRQFCDVGHSYRSAIFTHDEAQAAAARASLAALEKSKPFPAPIVTEIVPAAVFYPAEDYHQDYHLKNPLRYQYYRHGCGRDARLQQLWGSQAKH